MKDIYIVVKQMAAIFIGVWIVCWLSGCATFKANADLYEKKVQCEFPCWGGEIK